MKGIFAPKVYRFLSKGNKVSNHHFLQLATLDGEDAHKATLSGTVTTTNLEANVSTITLLTPRDSWDYIGQVGTLLETAGSIEKMYHYTAATGILVTAVDTEHGTITTENATFTNQQSIYRMNFRYLNPGSTKVPITAKSVTITSAGGVQAQRHLREHEERDAGPAAGRGPECDIGGDSVVDPCCAQDDRGAQKDLSERYTPVIDGLYFDVESLLVNLLVFVIGKQKQILATGCLCRHQEAVNFTLPRFRG